MVERPTIDEVENAIACAHIVRPEPYPHWCDAEHVLAAEVRALRIELQQALEQRDIFRRLHRAALGLPDGEP